jgi:hypothetical protein
MIYALVIYKNHSRAIGSIYVNEILVLPQGLWFLFSCVLKVPRFSAGSKENKKSKLSVLCVSAVSSIQAKTLLRSISSHPF